MAAQEPGQVQGAAGQVLDKAGGTGSAAAAAAGGINTIYLNGIAYTPLNGAIDLGTIVPGEHIQTVSGTTPTITGIAGYRYKCGEVLTLSITPPAIGTIDVIFSSGSTATTLTLPNTVKMPEWWDGPEANHIYELVITDGIYGVVTAWEN